MPEESEYVMPGEFEPHVQTWMSFPYLPSNWRMNAIPAQYKFKAFVGAIASFEPVTVCIPPDVDWKHAEDLLSFPSTKYPVRLVEMSANDCWYRDTAPSFVISNKTGEVVGINWIFNAWGGAKGGCYNNWQKDLLVGRKICSMEKLQCVRAPLILEGGSIAVDGEGTLITTEECLLNENRNPDLTKEEIENHLKRYLGVKKIIWLNKGLYKDEDTNGHIDNILSYVRPGEVVLSWTDDVEDPQYPISLDAYQRLSKATDAKGRKLTIHKMYIPNPLTRTEEEADGVLSDDDSISREPDRLPSSYANFYICNGGIVAPSFDDEVYDKLAEDLLKKLFPDRKVIMLPSREIVLGGGNIHCLTQQQPVPRIKMAAGSKEEEKSRKK